MSQLDDQLHSLAELLGQVKSALVILGPQATFDQQISASSLALALKSKVNEVLLLSPQLYRNPTIIGFDQLTDQIGRKNLLISFDYQPNSVDKVSYHLDEDSQKFYLTISPQAGCAPLDSKTVNFSYAGASGDLIFLIGVENLDQLEKLYFGYEDFFRQTPIVSLGSSGSDFATYELELTNFSCASELTANLIDSIWELDSDMATNLLAGIKYSTQNFATAEVTAATFEMVAKLIKAGARRSFASRTQLSAQPGLMTNQRVVNQRQVSLGQSAMTGQQLMSGGQSLMAGQPAMRGQQLVRGQQLQMGAKPVSALSAGTVNLVKPVVSAEPEVSSAELSNFSMPAAEQPILELPSVNQPLVAQPPRTVLPPQPAKVAASAKAKKSEPTASSTPVATQPTGIIRPAGLKKKKRS